MRSHFSSLTNCLTPLRQLRVIRRSLSQSDFQSLIPVLVLTKLNFGNATLAGIPSLQLNRLQAVMNAAAQLVSSWHNHITPLLYHLHWLRVLERIAYKHAMLVYQCFVDSRQPTWLTIYSLSLNFGVDNTFVHHRPRHWLYHDMLSYHRWPSFSRRSS